MKNVLLLIAAGALAASCTARKANLEVGDSLPAFSVTGATTSSGLLGKPSLIVLFATWCPGCQMELPQVQALYEKYGKTGKVAIVGFAREQTAAEVDSLWRQEAFTFPAYPDPERKIYALFAEKTIPRCYLFDASAKLVYKSEGYSPEQVAELINAVEQIAAF
ncbi:MAG: TlpA family protein disulfide reductase [Prevotellaceae bacterium]|jgi:thiol-disulfide isomerase/thioredoxin|nr:TlpA family protein disulfide reductase [Prevotellaceae bacterium]